MHRRGEFLNMASLRLFVMLVTFLSSFILNIDHSHSQSSTCLPENHRALFIFGDSIFDPGNNDYINATTFFQSNFSPYGETFFKYPSGRFSNGRVIPDFIGIFFTTFWSTIIIMSKSLLFFTLFLSLFLTSLINVN